MEGRNRITLKMRKLLYSASTLILTISTLLTTSCTSEIPQIIYEGKEFVQFGDSVYNVPVTQEEKYFEIPVVFSNVMDIDRHIVVDIDKKNSNATEGFHFTIEKRNFTIPAGQNTAMVRVKGNYNNISPNDSLAFTLNIVNHEDENLGIYTRKSVVHLTKLLPFNIDDYVGDMIMTCTFPFSTSNTTTVLLKSEKIDDHTLRILTPFEDARSLTIKFHEDPENPFDRNIDVRTQVAFTDVNYGAVSMSSVKGYPSYYIPQDRAFILYLNAELEHMGSFGTYYYVFEWITPDKALAIKNGLDTLY